MCCGARLVSRHGAGARRAQATSFWRPPSSDSRLARAVPRAVGVGPGLAADYDAVGLGPGLTLGNVPVGATRAKLVAHAVAAVVDADALKHWSTLTRSWSSSGRTATRLDTPGSWRVGMGSVKYKP